MPRPPKDPHSRLDKLIKQENQLKNKIQLAKNRLQTEMSKERSARLFAWGMVIEEQLESGVLAPETWRAACFSILKDYRLQKALTGPLAVIESASLDSSAITGSFPEQPLGSNVKKEVKKYKPSSKPGAKTTKQPKGKKASTAKLSIHSPSNT
ncbi:hypothetical protein [Vampirovibrio sp.]|uniref:hypothetical protein n=1 Tax=Vampirovibrio sp. TaxID=2717857 RepID=UPI00359493CB